MTKASASPPGTPQRGLFCKRLDYATPVTVETASRTVVQLGERPSPGRSRWADCTQGASRHPRTRAYLRSMPRTHRMPHDPLEHLQCSPPGVHGLRVIMANCGGLSMGLDPRKVLRLITYLACAEPDVTRLIEAGPHFAAARLAGLLHRVCVGALFPGRGLVTLVHARLLNGSQVCEHAQEHTIYVRVEPAMCRARRHLPTRGGPALCRRVAGRLAAPRVRGGPLPREGPSHPGARPPAERVPSLRACSRAHCLRACGARHVPSLTSPAYRLFRGRGLVTLVHARLLNGSQVCEHAQEHTVYVRAEPAKGAVLATVNLHLPPALPAARHRAVVGDASSFLRRAGASAKVVAGDLNKAQGPQGGGWLSKALGPKGPLAGFRALYRPGDPMNVVWQVGRPCERELDWILVGPETPCVGAETVLLPGLSTHRMVQCGVGFV